MTMGLSDLNVSDMPTTVLSDGEAHTSDLINIIVKDPLGSVPGEFAKRQFKFAVHPEYPVKRFLREALAKFSVDPKEYDLTYQDLKRGFVESLSSLSESAHLSSLGITPLREKIYSFIVEKIRRRNPKKSPEESTSMATAVGSDSQWVSSRSAGSSDMELSSDSVLSVDSGKFCGMQNRKMTCYLNTLIQSYWFLPEFRNLIFKFKSNTKENSVVCALQTLFVHLEFLDDSADTMELTASFGWNDSDSWQQHDIEELYNVLTEKIGDELESTPLKGAISALFGGEFEDYVKCLTCETVSSRNEKFSSLSLPIRNFNKPLSEPYLEKALEIFVEAETLQGDNQYYCEQCSDKVDAKKGLKILHAPYALCISLKRFEYDFSTMRKYKVNDEIRYPLYLNMNPFVMGKGDEIEKDFPGSQSRKEEEKDLHSRPLVSLPELRKRSPKCMELEEQAEALKKQYLTQGPHVYELLSVMVHKGTITGGHYYGYVKDTESSAWIRCDDTNTKKVTVREVLGQCGSSSYLKDDREAGSAYFFIYRRVGVGRLPFLATEIPEHITEIRKNLEYLKAQEDERELLKASTVKAKIFVRLSSLVDVVQSDVRFPKEISMNEALPFVEEQLVGFDEISSSFKNFDARLVIYDNEKDLNISSLDHQPSITLAELENWQIWTGNLSLEFKEKNEAWMPYSPSDFIVFVHILTLKGSRPDMSSCLEFHVVPALNMECFKGLIADNYKMNVNEMDIGFIHNTFTSFHEDFPSTSSLSEVFEDSPVSAFVLSKEHRNFKLILMRYMQYVYHSIDFSLIFPAAGDIGNSGSFRSYLYEACYDSHDDLDEHLTGQFLSKLKGNSVLKLARAIQGLEVPSESSSSNSSEEEEEEEEEEPVPAPKADSRVTYFQILGLYPFKKDFIDVRCTFDKRLDVKTLSCLVEAVLLRNRKNFVLYKESIEGTAHPLMNERASLASITPITTILVKLEKKLMPGDVRIMVNYLKEDFQSDPYLELGEVIVNQKATVAKLLALCAEEFKTQLPILSENLSKCILRRRSIWGPGRIYFDSVRVKDIGNTERGFLIQIVDWKPETEEEARLTKSVFMRRFWPSKLGCSEIREVRIKYDYTTTLNEVMIEAIKKEFNIPDDDLLIAVPKKDIYSFPWDLNPLALYKLTWLGMPLINEAKKISFQIHSDDAIIFVRDGNEPSVMISDDEFLRMKRENEKLEQLANGSFTLEPPIEQEKKETGIKIRPRTSP